MCSYCKNEGIDFSIPHATTNCPLRRTSYCSVCCSYGHLTEECNDHEVLKYRKPTYVEQLIPYSLLKQYNITTQTPLPTTEGPVPKYEPEWAVEDTDKAIRQVLMNYSIQPSGKSKENRRLLKQISDERNLKLVYIKCK
jgi:hypothetical protein